MNILVKIIHTYIKEPKALHDLDLALRTMVENKRKNKIDILAQITPQCTGAIMNEPCEIDRFVEQHRSPNSKRASSHIALG